jgi:hypothetical protein
MMIEIQKNSILNAVDIHGYRNFTNETDRNDIAEILVKVALNIITITLELGFDKLE